MEGIIRVVTIVKNLIHCLKSGHSVLDLLKSHIGKTSKQIIEEGMNFLGRWG